MHTRSRNKKTEEKTPNEQKVGAVTFRSPIGFEAIEKDYANRDVRAKGGTKDDENDGAESENSRESTPVLDDPSLFRNSPLRSTSAESGDTIKLVEVGEDEYTSKDFVYGGRNVTHHRRYINECNDYRVTGEGSQPLHEGNKNFSSDHHFPGGNNFWILCVIIPLCIIAAWIGYAREEPYEEPNPFEVNDLYLSKEDLKLEESLDNIREHFPSQDDNVWYTFGAGIKSITVEKPNKPSVFLLLYESNGKTPACLANEVSKLAISYIMGQNTMPIIVDGVQLKDDKALNKDSGELIVRYNKTVQSRGSLIVTNLHEVPANIVKSFHFFCDSYSPLIERAAYFFTLRTQGERLPINKLQHVAERTMRNLWSDSLKDHLLEPLITRLSGYVIRVLPESKMDGCDL